MPPPGTESTDFDLHESKQFVEHTRDLTKYETKLKGGLRWVLLIIIGMSTGLVGVCIDLAVENFFELRRQLQAYLIDTGSHVVTVYLAYLGVCLLLAAVAGFLVCYVEPLAAGSGIPEVKCYLNGVHLPNVVALKTLVAKAPGVMFSVAAGMPCGKEGPMIHSGACIGGVIAKAGAGPMLRPYRSDVETRDFVVAGAASGVAAAFGAPLGGVLFAMEEGATFFTPLIMLRTFVCSVSATLVVRFFLAGLQSGYPWGTMGAAAPLSFGDFSKSNWHIWELPIFALMGAAGGLSGALFNSLNTKLTKWRMVHVKGRGHRRYAEVFFVTSVIASIMFWMPIALCNGELDEKQFNNSAALLFRDPGTKNIHALFHKTEDFNGGHLFLFGCIYYCLACWCYGLGLPSGLFVPSLLTGAAFGRLAGQSFQDLFALKYDSPLTTDPGVYALIGATAMLSGMARITISLATILMEASGTVQWALPIFVTTMCSKWAGDVFTIGLYDIHINLKHIPLLEANPEKEMLMMKASDVMSEADKLLSFKQTESVSHILEVLEACDHHGFPVIQEGNHFVGLLKRETLLQILWRGKSHDVFQDPGSEAPSAMVPYKAERTYRSLDEIKASLTQEDLQKLVDLKPYINQGCYTVPEHASLTRVYKLFRGMGLRHLPVVNRMGVAVGMITRADLLLAEGHHH
jgi:chloride channel 7